MPKFKKYQPWQIEFIQKNSEEMTLQQLSETVKLPVSSLYVYCKENNLSTKHSHRKEKTEDSNKSSCRPAAVYTQINSSYGIANSCHGISLTSKNIR